MPTRVETSELAKLAYENAGREISQSFDIQNSNMALSAGALAALLTVLGTGNLFSKSQVGGVPKLTTTSLILLTVAVPLLFRFFIRALIAYQQLIRFNQLQTCCWRYLAGEESEAAFLKHHEIFIEKWRSPMSFGRLVVQNLKYGYFWVFTVSTVALVWAFYSSHWKWGRFASLALLAVAFAWEKTTLKDYAERLIKVPSSDEKSELAAAKNQPSHTEANLPELPAAEQ